MTQILIPDGYALSGERGPFDRAFFLEHFNEGIAPSCTLLGNGEVPVVVLELVNGEVCDIYSFEAFKRDYLIAQVFVDAPECDDFYLTFIRYVTIFRVNIRTFPAPDRRLGFKPGRVAVEEEGEAGGADVAVPAE